MLAVNLRLPCSKAWGRLELTAGLLVMRLAMRELGDRWDTMIAEAVGGMYARQVRANVRFDNAVGWELCQFSWNVSWM